MTEAGHLSKGGGWHSTEKFNEGSGKEKQVLACDFSSREGAGPYTVMFSIPGLVPGAARPNIQADILWKVQGTIKRTVSVQNGTSVQGVAEAVSIVVRDVPMGPPSGRTYSVTTLVAKGARGMFNNPPYLSPTLFEGATPRAGSIIVAPGANYSFNVPSDAGITSMFTTAGWNDSGIATPVGNSDLVVQQFGSNALKQYDARLNEWVPVIPNLQSVSFFNNNLAVVAGAVFSIAFGIDG